MCLTPVNIKNPNYHLEYQRALGYDVDSERMDVPCGYCSECRTRKQTDFLQRIQLQALHSYVYFFTLTYNKNVPVVDMANGKRLMYANYKHITDMFKRIRKQDYFNGRTVKYVVTDERGHHTLRPHYHGLLFIQKLPHDHELEYASIEQLAYSTILKEWRENIATTIAKKDTKRYKKGYVIPNTRCPVYRPLLDFHESYRGGKRRCTYDLHYVMPKSNGENDLSFYVTKYLFKEQVGVKYILKNCYDSADSKEEALKMYHQTFKCKKRQSLNLSNFYTDDSYKEYRSTHNDICLEISKDVFNYVKDLARISLKHDQPISFFDIYTGTPMPISKYLLDKLPEDMQLQHRFAVRKFFDGKPKQSVDSFANAAKISNALRNQERFVICDLFDDDTIIHLKS